MHLGGGVDRHARLAGDLAHGHVLNHQGDDLDAILVG